MQNNYSKVKIRKEYGTIGDVKKDMFEKGEYIPAVIYINGKHQPSASNPGYKLSNGEV